MTGEEFRALWYHLGLSAVRRIYEDRHTPPDLRWFWSITVYVDPKQGNTSGRAASLDEAKAQFLSN
jgi:hypothetical protein